MKLSSPSLRRLSGTSLLSLAVLLATGCADMGERTKGTLGGAAIGAAGGAAVSAMTGGKATTGAAVGGTLGAVAGNYWSKRMEDKRKAMEAATKGTGVEITRTADNQLQVNVPSDRAFEVGKSSMNDDLRPILDRFASGLDANMAVRVVGHTDSSGSDAVNNPLSKARADSVKSYLVARGVAADRVITEGKGEYQPVADNSTEAGRAKNRRVEIFLLDKAN